MEGCVSVLGYTWEGCVSVLGTCGSCLQVWHAGTHRKGVSVCWAPVDYACRYGMQVHMGGVCQCAGHLWIMLAGMACGYTWEGCVSVLGTCGSCLQVWHAGSVLGTCGSRYGMRVHIGRVCQCAGHLWIMLAGMACRYTWEGCVSVLGTCGSCLQVWHAGTHSKGVSVCWAPVDHTCRYGMRVHIGRVCQCAGHLWIMLAGMACRYTWEGCVSVLGTCGSCLQVWHAGTHGRGVSVCWAPVDHVCRYGMQVHMGGVCQCAGHLWIMLAGMACRYT